MKAKNWRWQVVACLLAALVLPMLGVGRAKASAVDGTWVIRDLVAEYFRLRAFGLWSDCRNQ